MRSENSYIFLPLTPMLAIFLSQRIRGSSYYWHPRSLNFICMSGKTKQTDGIPCHNQETLLDRIHRTILDYAACSYSSNTPSSEYPRILSCYLYSTEYVLYVDIANHPLKVSTFSRRIPKSACKNLLKFIREHISLDATQMFWSWPDSYMHIMSRCQATASTRPASTFQRRLERNIFRIRVSGPQFK